MKSKPNSFGVKLWAAFAGFAALIFLVLWLLQTVLLQTCYTGMAISGLKKTASQIAAQKDAADFPDILEAAARENSWLIFLTDMDGNVRYSADAYSALYTGETAHDGGNPYLSGSDALNWEKGAIRNLPGSHAALLEALCRSEDRSLGWKTEDGTAYVYGVKLEACAALSGENAVLCFSIPLASVAGTARILRVQLLWMSGFSLLLAFVLAWFLSRRFEKPVLGIVRQARGLARGDFQPSPPGGFCRELDELARTLNETAAALERSERSRRELLANVSHDLRTPLTMIKGYAELVREISWSDAAQRERDLDVIVREADRLTALVNEILEYSSLEASGQQPDMAPFDLSDAASGVLLQFEGLCREQGFQMERAIEPDVWVRGDRAQIQRVIYNFLDNAVNHAGSGRRVSLTLARRDGTARLSVRDDGPGIPEEELPYIWDRYYTARNRRNKAAASGLGLSIAREILTRHQAEFGADSGEGCTFWFELREEGRGN